MSTYRRRMADSGDAWLEVEGHGAAPFDLSEWRPATRSEMLWRAMTKPRLSLLAFCVLVIGLAIVEAAGLADDPMAPWLVGFASVPVVAVIRRVTRP